MTLYELCQRDVINITTGENLGRVDDITFVENSAAITHVVLYGRLKLFGLLGREEDTLIPWADIQKIGADVLLVETAAIESQKVKKHGFSNPFSGM
ncbi:MAG: YlmC/YmxH family sporulation protein [Ruthenibacterium sp.]